MNSAWEYSFFHFFCYETLYVFLWYMHSCVPSYFNIPRIYRGPWGASFAACPFVERRMRKKTIAWKNDRNGGDRGRCAHKSPVHTWSKLSGRRCGHFEVAAPSNLFRRHDEVVNLHGRILLLWRWANGIHCQVHWWRKSRWMKLRMKDVNNISYHLLNINHLKMNKYARNVSECWVQTSKLYPVASSASVTVIAGVVHE